MFGNGDESGTPSRRLKSRRLSEVKPSNAKHEPEINPDFERALFSEGEDEGSEFIRRRRRTGFYEDGTPIIEERIDKPVKKPSKSLRPAAQFLPDDDKPEEERAHEAALRILSYGANTHNRLVMKLTERGFSEEAANTACDRLEKEGILSDKREIGGAVMGLAKRYGPMRITIELKKLGFDAALIRSVDYEELGVDFDALCLKLAESRGKSDKTRAYLRSRGFTDSQIRKAFSAFDNCGDN